MRKYDLIPLRDIPALFRLRAIRQFGLVKPGDWGGIVQGEHNVSHDGLAWVGPYAKATCDAQVLEDALVGGAALAFEASTISGRAQLLDYARSSGNCLITDEAIVGGNAQIMDFASVHGCAQITENAIVSDRAHISGQVVLSDDAHICGLATLRGVMSIGGVASVDEHYFEPLMDENESVARLRRPLLSHYSL